MRPLRFVLSTLVVAASVSASVPAGAAVRSHAPLGLEDESFYQIFTRSMRDSNGDRQGDLKGIEESLPYLKKLGVSSILLTPIQPSPFYHNYFPDRPDGIDPAFGTMKDFRHLARAVHALGMKIYLDEEFQYVTYDHPWYRSAAGRVSSPFSAFFFFHGPNNSEPESGPFGVTIAQRFPGARTGITTINMNVPAFRSWATHYLMQFVDPDGNGDFSDGVDGFRIDHMMDDLDNKHIDTNLFAGFWKPLFTRLKERNPNLRILAEQWDWGFGEDFLRRGGADAVFAFPLANAIRSFDKAKIVDAIEKTTKATPGGKDQLIFVENHDMERIASDPNISAEKLRTAATLSLLLKGTPLIYYGQELGMRGKPRPQYHSDAKDIGDREAFRWASASPAPGEADWYEGQEAYWTQRFNTAHDGISVAEESPDPNSLLNHYRRLFAIRGTHPALREGNEQVLPSKPDILAVERGLPGEKIVIIANLSARQAQVEVSGRDLFNQKLVGGKLALQPFEARVLLLSSREKG